MCIIRPMRNYSELVSSFMMMHRIKRDSLSPPVCFMVVVCEESLGTVCYCRAAQYHTLGSDPATRQREVGERGKER